MKRIFVAVMLLFCLMVTINSVKGESIYAFSHVRFMQNSDKSDWLIKNKWELPRDSILSVLSIWSDELKEQKQWHDYLFIENEIANLNFLQKRAKEGVLRHDSAMILFANYNDTIIIEYSYSKLMSSQLYYSFDHVKSMQCMVELLSILDQLNHHSTYYSSSLFKTASFYLALDNRNKALELLQKLEYETEMDAITEINQKAMIAKLFAETQPRFSIDLMKTVIRDIDSLHNRKYTGYRASYTISMGYQHDLIGDHDKADEYYNEALKVFQGSSNYTNHHICLSNLASNSISRKEYDKAKEYLCVADSIADKHQYTQGKYRSLRMIGNMLSSQEQYDSAITYYKKAERILLDKSESNYFTTIAYVNYLISRNYNELNNPEMAILHAKKSIWGYNGYSFKEFDDEISLAPITKGVDYLISYPLAIYAKALETKYDMEKDCNIVDEIVNVMVYVDSLLLNQMNISIENERTIESRENLLPVFNTTIELCSQLYKKNQQQYALKALNASENLKSRTLLFERLGYHAKSLENDSLAKIVREMEISLLNAKSSVDSNLIQMQLTNLRNKQFNQNLNIILSDSSEQAFKRITPIDSTFLSAIPKDLSLVEYHLSDSILYTFVLNNESIEIVSSPVNQFGKKIKRAIREIKTRGKLTENNDQIYKILIEPIKQFLQEQIVFIPDESFAFLPLELLSDDNGLLINSYTISYNYSIGLWKESLIEKDIKKQEQNVLLIAPIFKEKVLFAENTAKYREVNIDSTNVIFREDNLVSLPFSEDEIYEIRKRFKKHKIRNKEIVGEDATEAMVRNVISDYSIVHFATHGMVSKQDVELSGLFFLDADKDSNYKNNGFISIKEFYNIDLSADLVVLSACKSGYGKVEKGEGVISLPRSFLFNGVPNVIASLWKVHDEKTKDLMVAFYKHLLEDKVSYAEALRLAKLDCINKGFLPLDWAGFILIGE